MARKAKAKDSEWQGALGLVNTRLAGKRVTWRLLLKQEANARLPRYVDARGRKALRNAIESACPLLHDETSVYRRKVWREECLRLLDIVRHPPPQTFTLSNDFTNAPAARELPCITRKAKRA